MCLISPIYYMSMRCGQSGTLPKDPEPKTHRSWKESVATFSSASLYSLLAWFK